MALRATLELEGKKYDVRDLSYELYKPYDNNNKPSAYPRGGIINFTILSPMKVNPVFHDWLLDIEERKQGDFYLPLTDGINHEMKKIHFEMAFCVRLQETYSSYNASQLYMQITISASVIKFEGCKFEYRNNDLQY